MPCGFSGFLVRIVGTVEGRLHCVKNLLPWRLYSAGLKELDLASAYRGRDGRKRRQRLQYNTMRKHADPQYDQTTGFPMAEQIDGLIITLWLSVDHFQARTTAPILSYRPSMIKLNQSS